MSFNESFSSDDMDNSELSQYNTDVDDDISAAFDGLDDTISNFRPDYPFSIENDQLAAAFGSSDDAMSKSSNHYVPYVANDQFIDGHEIGNTKKTEGFPFKETEDYETNETDRAMMKRSLDEFNIKASKRAKFINNSIEYYGKINTRLSKPHETIAEVYAADPYLANKEFFDNIEIGKWNRSTCVIPSKNYNSGEYSYNGTPLSMRKSTNDGNSLNDRLFDIVYFQNAEMTTIGDKPSPNCYNCASYRTKCHSSPGKGRCIRCKNTGDDMVCIFDGKWVPYAKKFPEHPWSKDILACDLYF